MDYPNVFPIAGAKFLTRNGSTVLIGSKRNHNLNYSAKVLVGGHGIEDWPGEFAGESYWIQEDGRIRETIIYAEQLGEENVAIFEGLMLLKQID